MIHFFYVPWTGLGLYNGFRGNRWLRNRIKVFKQFVVPSLQAQTSQNFIIWCSWRPEERSNPHTKELYEYLVDIFGHKRVVFTYSGVCFWDDKYPDDQAHERLVSALHGSLQEVINYTDDAEDILMTIQPSDDMYHRGMAEEVQQFFKSTNYDGFGYKKGYIVNYKTLEVHEYNPETNPPFFTIRFKKEVFIDPFKHLKFTGPYKSHEYIGDHLKYHQENTRGFMVGTHGENISTHFNHPYKGNPVSQETLNTFGIGDSDPLHLRLSVRKWILRQLPHGWQRKLRYWLGERFYAKFYSFIRN